MVARWLVTLCVVAGAAGTGTAWAECADPGEAGVDWRRCILDRQDLRGLDLAKAKLRDASFNRGFLDKASLAGADAYRAKFLSASLTGAKFDGARLVEADSPRPISPARRSARRTSGGPGCSARYSGKPI